MPHGRALLAALVCALTLASPASADSLHSIAVRQAADAATEGIYQEDSGPLSTGVRFCHRAERHRKTLIYACGAWVTTWMGDDEMDGFVRCDVQVRVYFVRGRFKGYWQKRGSCADIPKSSAIPNHSRRSNGTPLAHAAQMSAAVFPDSIAALGSPLAEDITDGLNRAAAYWHQAPACPGITFVIDQSVTGPRGAVSETPGCRVFIGDFFLGQTALERCVTLVHEWGHLIGHPHEPSAEDPESVMVYAEPDDPDAVVGLHRPSVCDSDMTANAAQMIAEAWAAKNAPQPPVAASAATPAPQPPVKQAPPPKPFVKLLRPTRGSVRLAIVCDCHVTAKLTVNTKTARALKLNRQTIARRTLKVNGHKTVTLKPTRSAMRAAHGRRSVMATLTVTGGCLSVHRHVKL